MEARMTALLEEHDAMSGLRQERRGGRAPGPAADDDDVDFGHREPVVLAGGVSTNAFTLCASLRTLEPTWCAPWEMACPALRDLRAISWPAVFESRAMACPAARDLRATVWPIS